MDPHPDLDASQDRTDADSADQAEPVTSTGNGPSSSKHRMKRMTLNDAQKYEVCIYMRDEEERSSRPTNKTVAAYIYSRYGIKVDESTVSRLKQQSEIRLSRDLANPSAKRHRQVIFPELERLLGEYVQENKHRVIITDPMIIKRGKELRDDLDIPEDQIKFSDGWLNKFKVRHGLKAPTVHKTAPTRLGSESAVGAGSQSPVAAGRARQVRALASSLELENSDMADSSPVPHPSSTSMEHSDDHSVDIDMELSASMDVDQPDSEQGLAGDQMLTQPPAHSSDSSGRTVDEPMIHTDAPTDPALQMELMSNAYKNSVATTALAAAPATALTAAAPPPPPDHHRPQTRLHRSSRSKAASASQSIPGPVQTIEAMLPMASEVASLGGENPGLGITGPVSGTPGAAKGSGASEKRPGAPATAARASLTMRLADPIAAGFQPEPAVDFIEASQCVNTLRIFMQQQNFSAEQLQNLKDIYLTLDIKRRQQD